METKLQDIIDVIILTSLPTLKAIKRAAWLPVLNYFLVFAQLQL